MKKSFITVIFTAAALILMAQSRISNELMHQIQEAVETDTPVEVLLFLSDTYDTQQLDQALKARKASPHERAISVITNLKQHADKTQKNLVDWLESKTSAAVRHYRPYWITNCIYVEAAPKVILELDDFPGIEMIMENTPVELITPVTHKPAATKSPGSAEPGLKVINAHKMWAKGITGEGVILANLDSGVDGDHPALSTTWRGNSVPPAHAWYDTYYGTTYPTDQAGHGTHTMGTMIGLDETTQDTIGVAFGAQWIAARLNWSTTISYYLSGLQWFMNPDGNPATTDDMPAVVSNSWGFFNTDCAITFLNAISNLEAAGIALVFAAGNSGPEPETILNPADLNATELTVFSVGALYAQDSTLPIANFSSRGPTPCNTGTGNDIKPEVSAPGLDVRSSHLGGGYATLSGTSMSTPHVAGAIALLKQAFPNKSGNELKEMLYEYAVDLGVPGEDNTYGMGIIDIYRAYRAHQHPENPKPPVTFVAYSDNNTPTSVSLSWIDPSELVNGNPLSSFEIEVWRDGTFVETVTAGAESYLDEGLTDGLYYHYALYTHDLDSDSLSIEVESKVFCGGCKIPSPPENLQTTFNEPSEIVLTWSDPSTQIDGSPLDDLNKVHVYKDNAWIAEVNAGAEIYVDTESLMPNNNHLYKLKAEDNESPPNFSEFSERVSGFVGDYPEILVWVGEDAWGLSAASGDTIYETIREFGIPVSLTKDLLTFANQLEIHQAIFAVLGVYPYNHKLDPGDEVVPLQTYLAGGGNLYLEGAACFNHDPAWGGPNIRPWFSLSEGAVGQNDVFFITGLNDLDTLDFQYIGDNVLMDELIPISSTPILKNSENTDILGVWWDSFGSNGAKTIGVVPSFGGLSDTSASCFREYLMCRYLNYFDYDFNCDSVIENCGNACLPDGIVFTTQEEIDGFQTEYPLCYQIGGTVTIEGEDITSLSGLSQIVLINGDLIIHNTTTLSNLEGLENLSSINGALDIQDNSALTSLTGIQNLESASINTLFILNNSSLSTCHVQSICDLLAVPGTPVFIGFNATGCNNQQQVEDLCDPVGVAEYEPLSFYIQPNPVSDAAHLRIMNTEHRSTILEVFTISGIRIKELLNEELSAGNHEFQIDLSDLPTGMYYCMLRTGHDIKTIKLIKL